MTEGPRQHWGLSPQLAAATKGLSALKSDTDSGVSCVAGINLRRGLMDVGFTVRREIHPKRTASDIRRIAHVTTWETRLGKKRNKHAAVLKRPPRRWREDFPSSHCALPGHPHRFDPINHQ